MENIRRNNLQSQIKVYQVIPDGPLIPLNILHIDRYLSDDIQVT